MQRHCGSRREFLATTAGVTGTIGLAGCLGGGAGGVQYVFSTNDEGGSVGELLRSYRRPPLAELSPNFVIDYPVEYKTNLVEALLTEGRVETVQLQYTFVYPFGTTGRSRPRFAERDGTHYRIVESSQRAVPTKIRSLYVEPVSESPPSSATVLSLPPTDLSETDAKIVERALEAVALAGKEPIDTDELSFPYRGVLLHDKFDAEASALVPELPFDYLERDGDYFAVDIERGTMELTHYTYTAEAVAESESALRTYVTDEVAVARIAPDDPPSEAQDVLATATNDGESRKYRERGSFSEGLDWLVSELGMEPYLPEDPADTEFDGALFEYDGRWLTARLETR
jgi:hypothetical protein